MSIATRHQDVRPSPPPPFAPPSDKNKTDKIDKTGGSRHEERQHPLLLSLVELDPREVVEGIITEKGFLAAEVVPVGPMREACPHCAGIALQLVLRHRHVKRSHLFCRVCTRCYDALGEGGHSVLAI